MAPLVGRGRGPMRECPGRIGPGPWPNAARALPHRPTPPPDKWGHVGPTPEGSRSFRYNTEQSETIPKSKNCFPLYESYSSDHFGTSRDVLDLIPDSEQTLISQLSILS